MTKFPVLVLFSAVLAVSVPAAPLTLEECLDLALGASPEVKAASLSLDASQAKQLESWGNFLPRATYQVFANQAQRDIYPYDSWDSLSQVSSAAAGQLAAAGYAQSAAALNALSQGLDSVTSNHMSGFGVGLVLPIDTSGKLWAASDLAGQQKDLAGVEYLRTREQMVFRVKKAYYQLWLAQKAVEVTQSSYDNLQKHVETAQSQLELGKISTFDVLRSRVQRDGVKPQLIAARNAVALAKLQLATLIHRDAGSFDVAGEPVAAGTAPSAGSAVEKAYTMRPEMQSTLLQTKMAESQIRLAASDLLPTTALSIQLRGVSTTDFSVSKWLEPDNRQWVAQLTVSGFLDAPTPARIAAANANAEAARQKLEAVRDQIRLDVEQALLNRQQSLEAVDATKASVELAQTAYDMAETRFAAGLATNLDVLDSRLALDQAQIGYYQSVAGAATSEAALDLALGK